MWCDSLLLACEKMLTFVWLAVRLVAVRPMLLFLRIMEDRFQWLCRNVELPQLDFSRLERWLEAVARSYGRMVGTLSYMFCDDEEILRVNREFLSHDYYTDIITFDDCRGRLLRGDMVISLDTVRSNAELQGTTYNAELLRVIVHGVLHLCGINDKDPGKHEIMEAAENKALKLLDSTL